jgi:hypothetical protein
MRTFQKKLIAILAVSILGIVASVFSSRQAAAQGGPNVHIASPLPLPVRNVDTPPQSPPVQFNLCFGSAFNQDCGPTPSSYLVPAGKRLVVEYVAGHCSVGTAVPINAFAAMQASLGGASVSFFFPLVPELQSTGAPLYDWAQHTQIFADGGTQLTLFSGSQVSAISPLCRAAVSGHLTTQ